MRAPTSSRVYVKIMICRPPKKTPRQLTSRDPPENLRKHADGHVDVLFGQLMYLWFSCPLSESPAGNVATYNHVRWTGKKVIVTSPPKKVNGSFNEKGALVMVV